MIKQRQFQIKPRRYSLIRIRFYDSVLCVDNRYVKSRPLVTIYAFKINKKLRKKKKKETSQQLKDHTGDTVR